ncbi:V4R domain-containing protein [Caryophanon latum]|uniref:4-vinyl reductase 4VR domain-containing protein n=1 Tax=Caryophanon latum TaxID=33977 RepID=A0A1C0YWQ7_9BACL|nr:V4R domain-containing protein [Caryophanon latum]OCS91555.1 hypothetical protein A6K76_08560 [Caryophanon latum]
MGNTQFKDDDKTVLMSASALAKLCSNLEHSIGKQKTKGFLYRFGKDFGLEAAKEYENKRDTNRKIGSGHVRMGHVKDVTFDGEILRQLDGSVQCINATGQWIGSFEAEIYVNEQRMATEPVCHTLCGFASGALSYEFGTSLIAIETKCIAKGDPVCEYEVRREEDWLEEQGELLALYNNDNILEELEMTYDALVHHKQLLEKLSVFQTQLTQNVTDRYSLHELVDEAYRLLHIPLLIEDVHGQILKTSGLQEDNLSRFMQPEESIFQKDEQNSYFYKGNGYYKLSSAVRINKKHYATCSFIYEDVTKMQDSDSMFLEKIASVIALCILYEEARFEEQQRTKSSIIERLIHQQNVASIEASLKFLPFKFSPPYTVATIQITPCSTRSTDIDYYEQIVQLSRLFEQWSSRTIITAIGEELVLVTSHDDPSITHFKDVCQKIVTVFAERQQLMYNIGISTHFTHFTQFEQAFKEAHIAQNFENNEAITHYKELGILGDFVTNMSVEQIHQLSEKMLRGLYDYTNPRIHELLHTLYVYLLNNQRLKETMNQLSLSIGGIQYRIKQIEEILGDTLKNASLSAYLLLLIQSLLLLGELTFEQ